MSEISTPRTHTTGQFEAVRAVTDAPETNEAQLLLIRDRLAQETAHINARLRGRLITPDQAREILGSNLFFGADSANRLYGTGLTEADIAHIPFNLTQEEAENAVRLGHTISLHVPLSMLDLNKYVVATQQRKAIYNTDWYGQYQEEAFGTTPDVLEWRETSIKPVPNTFLKDYLVQTDLLIKYVQEELYKGKPLPTNLEAAIREFRTERPTIDPLIRNWNGNHASGRKNYQVALSMLTNLQITKLTRPTPESIMQDITNLQSVGTNMLETTTTWTQAQYPYSGLVSVGHADSLGAHVSNWGPNARDDNLGASFSRSLSR